MELYFGSMQREIVDTEINTLVTFDIPDIGVTFKAPYQAEGIAKDYASLLTLLEFIEVNPQLFKNRALELYCNNLDLVEQVQNSTVDNESLVPLLQKALVYRSKLRYTINWVSLADNPAERPEID
ncbi:MAG: hypothetical protein KAR42_02225 [candidate division Zixibacteria bacterium]|nr:hypothetical protein [candidate division Zixibacteria bacterium]